MTAIVLDLGVLLWLFAMVIYCPLSRKLYRASDGCLAGSWRGDRADGRWIGMAGGVEASWGERGRPMRLGLHFKYHARLITLDKLSRSL
jgi:hypothetical protein